MLNQKTLIISSNDWTSSSHNDMMDSLEKEMNDNVIGDEKEK